MYPYRLDIHLQTLTCHIHFYHHFFLTSFRLLSDFTAKFMSFLFYDPFFSYCFCFFVLTLYPFPLCSIAIISYHLVLSEDNLRHRDQLSLCCCHGNVMIHGQPVSLVSLTPYAQVQVSGLCHGR